MAEPANPFVDLRRLVDWFQTRPTRPSLHVDRIVQRLGATCVPLLGRELCTPDRDGACRRDAARAALARLASTNARPRVIAELHRITESDASDEGKVCAVGLLAELGERGAARFTDPSAIQRRSAIALAAQLETAADIANAADMMVRSLADHDLLQLLAVMAETVPAGAHRLATELCARLDVAAALRQRICEVAVRPHDQPVEQRLERRAPRPTIVSVLADAVGRLVVIASRKLNGERAWRRWAVLVGAHGRIDDCLHEEACDDDAAGLVASLVGDGYRVTSSDFDRARDLVSCAARTTGSAADASLPAGYYVGRDLLDLGTVHLPTGKIDPTSATLGRAVELIAEGELVRAQALLARCDQQDAEVAAATAACLLAQSRPAEATSHLALAIEAEPSWPLHHWNLAVAYHQLGDTTSCYGALRRFIATSAAPSGLSGDPDQPARVALATRLMAELERTARLTGTALDRPRRKRRTTKRSARGLTS